MLRFIYTDVPLQLGKVSNNRLIHENSLGISEHLSKITLGESITCSYMLTSILCAKCIVSIQGKACNPETMQ